MKTKLLDKCIFDIATMMHEMRTLRTDHLYPDIAAERIAAIRIGGIVTGLKFIEREMVKLKDMQRRHEIMGDVEHDISG